MIKIPQFVKFTMSSLLSCGVDFLFFFLVSFIGSKFFGLDSKDSQLIITATVIARIISTIVNFTINKLWAFQSKKSATREVILFTILFLAKMAASAALVSYIASLDFVKIQTLYIKMIVDSILFFVSYAVQKLFIF